MLCPKCRNSEHLAGAHFCMICGACLEPCEDCVKGRKTMTVKRLDNITTIHTR